MPCTGDTGGLVTTEEYQWVQDPAAQTRGYHPVLPRDPESGIPWLTVRPEPAAPFELCASVCWCAGSHARDDVCACALTGSTALAPCMLCWCRHPVICGGATVLGSLLVGLHLDDACFVLHVKLRQM